MQFAHITVVFLTHKEDRVWGGTLPPSLLNFKKYEKHLLNNSNDKNELECVIVQT